MEFSFAENQWMYQETEELIARGISILENCPKGVVKVGYNAVS
jgi:hypothetical protein